MATPSTYQSRYWLKLVKSHRLTEYERRELEAGMRMPPIAFFVRGLSAEGVPKVYEKGTEQEKRDLLRYDREALVRVIDNRLESAARAKFEDRLDDANRERHEASRLAHEFQQFSGAQPPRTAGPVKEA